MLRCFYQYNDQHTVLFSSAQAADDSSDSDSDPSEETFKEPLSSQAPAQPQRASRTRQASQPITTTSISEVTAAVQSEPTSSFSSPNKDTCASMDMSTSRVDIQVGLGSSRSISRQSYSEMESEDQDDELFVEVAEHTAKRKPPCIISDADLPMDQEHLDNVR